MAYLRDSGFHHPILPCYLWWPTCTAITRAGGLHTRVTNLLCAYAISSQQHALVGKTVEFSNIVMFVTLIITRRCNGYAWPGQIYSWACMCQGENCTKAGGRILASACTHHARPRGATVAVAGLTTVFDCSCCCCFGCLPARIDILAGNDEDHAPAVPCGNKSGALRPLLLLKGRPVRCNGAGVGPSTAEAWSKRTRFCQGHVMFGD